MSFKRKECLLVLDPVAVAGQDAARAYGAVAGNDQAYRDTGAFGGL